MNIIKKYKLAFIAIALIVLVIVLLILLRRSPEVNSPSPTNSGQLTSNQLLLISKDPITENISSPWSVEPVTFVFNKNIDPVSIKYTISPQVDSKIKYENNSPTQFSIIPLTGWEEGKKYDITITQLKSVAGETLAVPIKTSIVRTFDPQELPDHIE